MARPQISGRERLDGIRPPAVIVANHASHLDTALLIAAMPPGWRDRLAVGAAADTFFTSTSKGWAAALVMGAFPVERHRASAVSARMAIRLAEEGWSLILFPEGGRSETGWLQDLQPGAAFVAAKAGRPLVPVWLHGTDHLWPKGHGGRRRGRVRIHIGDPLHPYEGESPRELNARLTEAMRSLGRESSSDWWQALRGRGPSPLAPDAARWRQIWARGEPRPLPRSDWD